MKKFFAAAAVVAAISAMPAMAQTTDANNGNADVTISGTIAAFCTVSPEERSVTLDLSLATPQSGGSLTYRCNGANGFTRTISSDNAGQLNNAAGANRGFVPYTITHGGGSGLAIATAVSLSTPVTTNLGSSAAFVNGQTGSLSVIAARPASASATNPLFAGTYSDVIRVSIVAN